MSRWWGWVETIEPSVGDPGREVFFALGIPLWHRCIFAWECSDSYKSLFGKLPPKHYFGRD